ncbi:PAXNEB-domain-containing protein [Trametes gibbosa]|nr:PAXNEB-domain-containing protein [Trametes gibbosa]
MNVNDSLSICSRAAGRCGDHGVLSQAHQRAPHRLVRARESRSRASAPRAHSCPVPPPAPWPAARAMSAFKRRTTEKQLSLPAGTRTSPGSPATTITSTGIPSLDDILGGGLPLSCSLLVLAPDTHTAYGELVIKYAAAQGLASGQRVCVVGTRAEAFLSECMWVPGSTTQTHAASSAGTSTLAEDADDEQASEHDTKIKIAWRYEQMRQFQTTVPAFKQKCARSPDDYCRTFDLTSRMPEEVIKASRDEGRLVAVDLEEEGAVNSGRSSCIAVIRRLSEILARTDSEDPLLATRVCIPALGSYEWGDLSPHDICYFLLSLRALIRRHPRSCASVCLPPDLCQEAYGGPGWVQKLGWLTDAAITLAAFSSNPSLVAMFSSHHGLVHIHILPSPHTLLPPSDKYSTLRGLSSSGENNLAFKCMRKRLIFETLHLDVEGGISERRTTPSATAGPLDFGDGHAHHHGHEPSTAAPSSAIAAVQVQLEQAQITAVSQPTAITPPAEQPRSSFKKAKVKKKVVFTSERPDLYDF